MPLVITAGSQIFVKASIFFGKVQEYRALVLKTKGSYLGWKIVSGQSSGRELIKFICQLEGC